MAARMPRCTLVPLGFVRSASARLMVALAILDDDPLDDRGVAAVASVGGGVI
jgi:hypothetical protein